MFARVFELLASNFGLLFFCIFLFYEYNSLNPKDIRQDVRITIWLQIFVSSVCLTKTELIILSFHKIQVFKH